MTWNDLKTLEGFSQKAIDRCDKFMQLSSISFEQNPNMAPAAIAIGAIIYIDKHKTQLIWN